jgi:hypothetical protein
LLIVAGLIIALLVFAFVLMWSGWFLIFFFINGTGFAGRKLKEIVSRRAMLRYTLVVETRTGPVYAYRSSNLLYSKRIAAKINEMVRRRMVSQG